MSWPPPTPQTRTGIRGAKRCHLHWLLPGALWAQSVLKVFKMMVEAQGGLARLLGPSRLTSLPAYGKAGLAQGRCQELWLSMQPPAQVSCSSVSCTHLGMPAFEAAPYSLGPTSWNSQSKDSEQQLQAGCPARKARVLPGASGGSVGGTLHSQGTRTFPKVSPAPAAPATHPGAAQGSEPCSPSQGFSSLHHAWGYPLEVHPGDRIQMSFQPWKRVTAKLSAFSLTAQIRAGACGRSHPECPEMCGLRRVFSPRNS